MSDVTRVPTELWRIILTWSCTDGGFTGKSLALTSRFFHAQSISARFHSITLMSLQQVEDFLAFVRAQPKDCQPRIEHLFLSFLDESDPLPRDHWRTYSSMSQAAREACDKKVDQDKKAWNKRFVTAMSTLFVLVSPTLRTLGLVSNAAMQWEHPHIPFDVLPVLEELGIWANIDILLTRSGSSEEFGADAWSALPALRRFHYVSGNLWQRAQVTNALTNGIPPPFLTHIRLSGIGIADAASQTSVIGRMLGLQPDASTRNASHAPPLPPAQTKLDRLQHFVLHGFPPRPGGWCGTNDFVWDDMCMQMDALSKRCRHEKGINMLVMSRPYRQNPRWPDRLHNDWLARIEGGRGPWVESHEEEAGLEVYEDDPWSPVSVPYPDDDDDL